MDFIRTMDYSEKVDKKELFATMFEILQIAESSSKKSYEKLVKKNSSETNLVKTLIQMYYENFETNYEVMIYNFKKKYIQNEAKVEYNAEDQKLELVGLGYMYDYIQEYKPKEHDFNIFIQAMMLHSLLYKPFDDIHKKEREKERLEYENRLKEALEKKDLKAYRSLRSQLKSFSDMQSSFGGSLRTTEVDLNKVEYHIPSSKEASLFLNSFLNPEKKQEYEEALNNEDIFTYIEYCVKTYVDIIKYQPFNNGNKRTARALLNLMFKNRNIPPVYILRTERKPYKEALLEAITTGDCTDITNFYYFKICDSIYELDILPYIEMKKERLNNEDYDMKIYTIGSKAEIVKDDSDLKIYKKITH